VIRQPSAVPVQLVMICFIGKQQLWGRQSHHTRAASSSWQSTSPRIIRSNHQKWRSQLGFITRTLTRMAVFVWIFFAHSGLRRSRFRKCFSQSARFYATRIRTIHWFRKLRVSTKLIVNATIRWLESGRRSTPCNVHEISCILFFLNWTDLR